jgi:hypothetical protein
MLEKNINYGKAYYKRKIIIKRHKHSNPKPESATILC